MTPSPEPVVAYKPGETFTCWKRPVSFDPDAPYGQRIGEPCGATVVMHGYHWCSQVCPACLAIYQVRDSGVGSGGQRWDIIRSAFGSWFERPASVRDNIARHGGQYVPEF